MGLSLQPIDRSAYRRWSTSTISLIQTLVTRAVRRGLVAEAAVAYRVRLAGGSGGAWWASEHDPDRFDFGARYLDRDLPAELRAEVEALALPDSLAAVEAFRSRAQALFDATLAELDRLG